MIPEFPQFKSIELSDKEEVEKITKKYPPYSDFNFVSMWSWDIKGEMLLSMLNNNLVVRFTDYVTGEPFYSFLGGNKVNETVEKLLNLSKKEGLKLELKLVPEDSVKELDSRKFQVVEDLNHFDYVLSTEILKDYSSQKTKNKRRAVKALKKEYSPVVELLDMSDLNHQKRILEFIRESLPDEKVIEREFSAISRFMQGFNSKDFLVMGAFINSNLVGFCFTEILDNKFANFHFWKANTKKYKPMYSFLLQEKAKLLCEKYDCQFLNIEQDLGIEKLKQWKTSFGTNFFLRKYVVSLQN